MLGCPRLGRRGRLALGLALAPPILWALVVATLPTDWARRRLVDRLAAELRQPVRVGAVRLGLLGGARVLDLAVGDPALEGGPWLAAREVRIDLSLAQMVLNGGRPSEVRVVGASVRVRRRADGTLELGGLLDPNPKPDPAARPGESRRDRDGDEPIRLRLVDGRVALIDELSGSVLVLNDLEVRAVWADRVATVEHSRARVNGGHLELVARFDRGGVVPEFEGQVRARGVALDSRMPLLGHIVPLLAGGGEHLEGRMDLALYGRGRGRTLAAALASTVGHGSVRIDPVRLEGCRLLDALADAGGAARAPSGARVGALRSDFAILDRRVATENLTLELAGLPLSFAGWTDFDGRVDYRLKPEGLVARLPREAREALAEYPELAGELGEVRLTGTLEQATVSIEGGPVVPAGAAPAESRDRLRRLGRRLRDTLIR